MDLRAIPFVLKGYREIRRFDGEDTIEARVLWDQIMNVLRQLGASLKKGRPNISYTVEFLRFVLTISDERFRQWFP
jgi:hypothetical protein